MSAVLEKLIKSIIDDDRVNFKSGGESEIMNLFLKNKVINYIIGYGINVIKKIKVG